MTRIPYLIVAPDQPGPKDSYGGAVGTVALEAMWLKPETPLIDDLVVVMMHPIGGTQWLPLPAALARRGVHVIAAGSRYRGTDVALVMEKVALDLGTVVRDARERLGFRRVVLGGWSGGGALALFWQALALGMAVTATPAGDPVDLSGLVPADGVMLLAAHLSRNRTLTEWLDPSIEDESRPFARNRAWNLYAQDGPKPPFSADFLAEFRARQVARNRRITAWVEDELAARPGLERGFVVQGTMADPRFLDPTLEPSDRRPGWCYLGEPAQVNDGPVGLGRFSSLKSWLSQWSFDRSNADGLACAAHLRGPLLVVEHSADDACTPGHAAALMAAARQADIVHHVVAGANHYLIGQPAQLADATDVIADWLERLR